MLVAALRLPDEQRTDGPCTADARGVRWFVLLDDEGRWVRPERPTHRCGKPRGEALRALAELRLIRVATRTVGEIESAELAAAGL